MKRYFAALLDWAEPGYRYVSETAAELAVLAARGVRLLFRLILAALLFPPWLLHRAVLWARNRARKGRDS